MAKVMGILMFVVYVIVGLYLLAVPFDAFSLPESISFLDQWIFFIGGFLVLFGGVKYLFKPSKKRER